MLISYQDCGTLEHRIKYSEISAIIADQNMIQIHRGIMKQGAIFSQKFIL